MIQTRSRSTFAEYLQADSIAVLSVDDEPGILRLYSDALEQADDRFTVHTATSAREALSVLSTETIDCVVSDYDMPGVDGIELLDQVRDEHPKLPFILHTGKGDEEVASTAIAAGVTDYLPKSTDQNHYQELAERIVDRVEQYRAEQLQRRFQTAVEHAGHSIYITDSTGVIKYVNSTFEEITGYSASEAIGQTPRLLKSGVHDDEFYADLWETILDGEIWEDELVNEHKSGEKYVVNQTIAPIVDERGEPESFIAINQEITDLKAYEQTLEDQRDNLEVLNQMVRHDIRNDLQLVISYAELLDETGYLDDEDAEHLDVVLDSARNAVDLTGTARNLAEVLLQTDTDQTRVRIRPLLESARDEVKATADHAEITTEGDLPEATVRANEMLESVFRNLLKNAVQHNDKATPEVTISGHRTAEDVIVRIADNGPGIPETRTEQIFEKGTTRLENDDQRGIGLHLVQTLVEEYGGSIWVEANRPEGAVFNVQLPIAE